MHSTSPSPKRSTVVVAAVATVMLVAGIVFTRFLGGDGPTEPAESLRHDATEPARPPAPRAEAGPTLERGGLDVGFAADEDGAIAAAISYSTASQRWLYFSDEEIRDAVDEIATPIAGPRMADQIVLDVSTAREQLAASDGRIWWLVRPLAWRVDHSDDTEARISVWTITILSAAGVAAPQAEYMTVTLDLAWVDGDWRVDGVRDTPGPTPMTGPQDQPWDAEPFDQTLAGFTRMDGESVQ